VCLLLGTFVTLQCVRFRHTVWETASSGTLLTLDGPRRAGQSTAGFSMDGPKRSEGRSKGPSKLTKTLQGDLLGEGTFVPGAPNEGDFRNAIVLEMGHSFPTAHVGRSRRSKNRLG
jgi:hypothetical protein